MQLEICGTLTNAECSTDVYGYSKLNDDSLQQQFSHESPTTDSVKRLVRSVGKEVDYAMQLVIE
jgi:hypothetical protein